MKGFISGFGAAILCGILTFALLVVRISINNGKVSVKMGGNSL